MSILEQLGSLFRSRKFWALLAGLAAIAAGFSVGDLTQWQAVQALVAALAAYSLGVAIEDNGR